MSQPRRASSTSGSTEGTPTRTKSMFGVSGMGGRVTLASIFGKKPNNVAPGDSIEPSSGPCHFQAPPTNNALLNLLTHRFIAQQPDLLALMEQCVANINNLPEPGELAAYGARVSKVLDASRPLERARSAADTQGTLNNLIALYRNEFFKVETLWNLLSEDTQNAVTKDAFDSPIRLLSEVRHFAHVVGRVDKEKTKTWFKIRDEANTVSSEMQDRTQGDAKDFRAALELENTYGLENVVVVTNPERKVDERIFVQLTSPRKGDSKGAVQSIVSQSRVAFSAKATEFDGLLTVLDEATLLGREKSTSTFFKAKSSRVIALVQPPISRDCLLVSDLPILENTVTGEKPKGAVGLSEGGRSAQLLVLPEPNSIPKAKSLLSALQSAGYNVSNPLAGIDETEKQTKLDKAGVAVLEGSAMKEGLRVVDADLISEPVAAPVLDFVRSGTGSADYAYYFVLKRFVVQKENGKWEEMTTTRGTIYMDAKGQFFIQFEDDSSKVDRFKSALPPVRGFVDKGELGIFMFAVDTRIATVADTPYALVHLVFADEADKQHFLRACDGDFSAYDAFKERTLRKYDDNRTVHTRTLDIQKTTYAAERMHTLSSRDSFASTPTVSHEMQTPQQNVVAAHWTAPESVEEEPEEEADEQLFASDAAEQQPLFGSDEADKQPFLYGSEAFMRLVEMAKEVGKDGGLSSASHATAPILFSNIASSFAPLSAAMPVVEDAESNLFGTEQGDDLFETDGVVDEQDEVAKPIAVPEAFAGFKFSFPPVPAGELLAPEPTVETEIVEHIEAVNVADEVQTSEQEEAQDAEELPENALVFALNLAPSELTLALETIHIDDSQIVEGPIGSEINLRRRNLKHVTKGVKDMSPRTLEILSRAQEKVATLRLNLELTEAEKQTLERENGTLGARCRDLEREKNRFQTEVWTLRDEQWTSQQDIQALTAENARLQLRLTALEARRS